MTTSKAVFAVALVASASLTSGCYEEPTVEIHEPGEYQGASDPLLEIAGSPAQNDRLAERFLAVQTDR